MDSVMSERSLRGTKRSVVGSAKGSASQGQENQVPTNSNVQQQLFASAGKKLSSTMNLDKPAPPSAASAGKFGFRGTSLVPTGGQVASVATSAVTILATPSAKRRKTDEDKHLALTEEEIVSDILAPMEAIVAAPAEQIERLFRESVLDEATLTEAKNALAGKVKAGKFDYKEKITELELHMKALRKVVGAIVKKQGSFLADAARIEYALNESVAKEQTAAREIARQRDVLQDKVHKALQLVKATQGQRDALLAESKSSSALLAGHAQVLATKDAEKVEIERRAAQVQKDLLDTLRALDGATAEREEAKKLLVELQVALDTLQVELAKTEAQRDQHSSQSSSRAEEIARQKSELAAVEAQLGQAKLEFASLAGQFDALRKEHERSEATVQSLTSKLAQSEQEAAEATKERDAAKEALAVAEHALAKSGQQHASEAASAKAAFTREMDSLRGNMESALEANRAEIASLTSQLASLQASKSALSEAAAKSALDLVELRGTLLAATGSAANKDLESKRLEGEVALLRVQLDKKNEECFVTVKSFTSIQKFHEERMVVLQGEKEALELAKQQLLSKVAQVESSLKSTAANLEATTSSLAERTAALEALKLAHEAHVAQAKEDKAAWTALEGELRASIATMTSDMASKTAAFESRLAELSAKLESETARADNGQRELQSFKALSGVSSESQLENLVKLSMEAEVLRNQVADKGAVAAALAETKSQLEEALRRVAESEVTRRQLHNTIQELKGNIRVFTRPMFHAGAAAKDASGDVVMPSGDDSINAVEVSSDGRKVRLDTGSGSKVNFSFDAVWGPNTTQKEIFDEISQLVQSALDGYHVCLFSYGQTGAGKTHTMAGGPGESRGIIPRSVEKVLEQAQLLSTGGWSYTLEASCLEIHNEAIKDLLVGKDSPQVDLDVKRDASGRTNIPGLTRCAISSANDVHVLLARANKNRATAATNMNERSSRSHSVFTLYLSASNPLSKQTLSGSLNLCDLAGSERLAKSGATGERLKETQSINKSLSSLGDVFLSLSQKSSHVPFRNSKLTYLLQPCLSGDGKTAMIVNLNPSLSSANESHCTLRFAAQVTQVELGKPKKSAKSGEEAVGAIEAMAEKAAANAAATAAANGSQTARPSLSGSASASSLSRPTASSGLKKPTPTTARPTTGSAMRR